MTPKKPYNGMLLSTNFVYRSLAIWGYYWLANILIIIALIVIVGGFLVMGSVFGALFDLIT